MKFIYAAGAGAVLIAVAVGAYLTFAGDALTKELNKRWPPVNVERQRQRAIDSAAATLNAITAANFAAGTNLEPIEGLAGPLLKPKGVTALRLKGDHQMLRLEADFDHTFTAEDLPATAEGRDLVAKLKPHVIGTAVLYLGITSAVSRQGGETLQLRLLPAFHSLHIEKVTLADRTDVTAITSVLVAMLNRYSGNLTAAINESPVLSLSIPSAFTETADLTNMFKMSVPDAPDVKVTLTSKPVTSPFRIGAVALLIDDNEMAVVVQFVPAAAGPLSVGSVTATYDAMKASFLARLKDGLGIATLPAHTWGAVAKALLAEGLNAAFGQAQPCVAAVGNIPKQSFSQQIAFPDASKMDCTPTRNCTPTRACDFQESHDNRDCRACLVRNVFTGGCSVHGNDPICEGLKDAQNKIYKADYALKKGDCERLKTEEKIKCEAEKTTQKVGCEAAKKSLDLLAHTGKFANLKEDVGGPANLKVCARDVKFSNDLSHLSLALHANGDANLAVHIAFDPLDVVGHLACASSWTEDRNIHTTVVDQTIPITVQLLSKPVAERQTYEGSVDEFALKLRFDPSPTALILQSTNFMLACAPLAGLINGVTMNLAPLIPELLKDYAYRQKSIEFSFTPEIPDVKVLQKTIKPSLSETPLSLSVTGTI